MNKPPMTIADAAQEQLASYRWPGNVRELQNCIERAVILADDGRILAHHLNLGSGESALRDARDPWSDIDLAGSLPDATRRVVAEVEQRKIRAALAEAGGDAGRASDILGVDCRVLLSMCRQYQIPLA